MSKSSYNIFYTPHKPWRAALKEFQARANKTDYNDPSHVRDLTVFGRKVLAAYKNHVKSEDNVLSPALKRPDIARRWLSAHDNHDYPVRQISSDLSILEKYSNPSKMVDAGQRLQHDIEEFISEDNIHTHIEEGFMSSYAEMYNEEELFDLDVRATTYWSLLDDNVKEDILPFFIRAHNSNDLIRILKIWKQILNDKPEAWQKFVEMARRELSPNQITKFESLNLLS